MELNIYLYVLFLPAETARSKDILVALSTSNLQDLASKYYSPFKGISVP